MIGKLARRIDAFFLTPATARPLAALRIGLATILIVQVLMLRQDALSFYAHDGIVQGPLADYLSQANTPRLGSLVSYLAPFGITEAQTIYAVTSIYLMGLVFLLLGLWTRAAAVLTFFLQWMLMNSGYSGAYGFDTYAHIFLFYLMWMPSGNAYALDNYFGRTSDQPSPVNRLGLRVMQIHVALAYLASAIEKSTIDQWWNGELVWRVMSLPEYKQVEMGWLAEWPLIAVVAGWGALVTEAFFCVFIWGKRTRFLWLGLTLSLHVGIAIFLGLHIFGAIMCILIVSLFGVSPEPVLARVSDGSPAAPHGLAAADA